MVVITGRFSQDLTLLGLWRNGSSSGVLDILGEHRNTAKDAAVVGLREERCLAGHISIAVGWVVVNSSLLIFIFGFWREVIDALAY